MIIVPQFLNLDLKAICIIVVIVIGAIELIVEIS